MMTYRFKIAAALVLSAGAAQAQAPGSYTLLESLAGGGCSAGYSAVAAVGALAGYDTNGDGQVCLKPYSPTEGAGGGGGGGLGGLGGAGGIAAGLGALVIVGALAGGGGGSGGGS
jgi:hypothetical protein